MSENICEGWFMTRHHIWRTKGFVRALPFFLLAWATICHAAGQHRPVLAVLKQPLFAAVV
jgi:hypothetical protein